MEQVNRYEPKVFQFCATITTKYYVSRHSTTHVSSSRLVTEFRKISELHGVSVIYKDGVCFVFKWRGDYVKAETSQSVRTLFHWLREGIYKKTKCKNVFSLIERRENWSRQEYEFFARIRSLRSANFTKHSVIDWQKRLCKLQEYEFLAIIRSLRSAKTAMSIKTREEVDCFELTKEEGDCFELSTR